MLWSHVENFNCLSPSKLADAFGLSAALAAIGGLTVLSAVVIARRMYCLPMAGETASASGCAQPPRATPYFPARLGFTSA